MNTLCPACQTHYTLREGQYICQQGHVSAFFEQDFEPDNIILGARISNSTGNQILKEDRGDLIVKMLLKLYYIMKRKLQFVSDDTLKIFINYYDSKQRPISSMKGWELRIVFYISLRKEIEKKGGLLTYKDFCERFDQTSYSYTVTSCAREIASLKNSLFLINHFKVRSRYSTSDDDLIDIYKKLNEFDFYHYIIYVKQVGSTMNCAKLQKYFDNIIKSAIPVVEFVGKEKKIIFRYFLDFVKFFYMRLTVKLVNDFRWFWEHSDHINDVFIPEIRIVPFLYIYALNNQTEINIKANLATLRPKETSFLLSTNRLTDLALPEYKFRYFSETIEDMFTEPNIIYNTIEKNLLMIFSEKSQIQIKYFQELVRDNLSKLYVRNNI